MHKVVWSKKAEQCLEKIAFNIRRKLKTKADKYLALDPYVYGEDLQGKYEGYYRYRYRDYRVIYEIEDELVLVQVIKVDHRKEVYR